MSAKTPLPFICEKCDQKREWNCRNNFLNLKESVIDNTTEDNRQELREKRDHRGKKISKVSPNLAGLRFYECPTGWISSETNTLIQLLTSEDSPPKIFPGTWLNQPHWYIEAKQIYNIEKNKWLQAPKP